MPLFYFRPMDFHADKDESLPLIEFDFDVGATLITMVVIMIALALFVVFAVFPLLQVLAAG